VLERLADARPITLDDGRAEVAHEALIREWP
jgi:Novel STAND NTPase 1